MKIIILLVCCSALAMLSGIEGNASMQSKSSNLQASADTTAAALWEQAIEAKGGRSSLYGVTNILEAYSDKSHVSFCVFPGRFWRFTDDRPTWLGVSVAMNNVELKVSYNVEEGTPNPAPNLGENYAKESLWTAYYQQLYYLLETPRIKPLPVRVYSGAVDHHPVDVVETLVRFPHAPRALDSGYRVDFHLDKRSHLPLKVAFPSDDSQGINYGRGTYYVTFADYAKNLQGIQMPRKVGHDIKPEMSVSVQVNVDFDPGIFERLPNLKDGPDAWRPRKQ